MSDDPQLPATQDEDLDSEQEGRHIQRDVVWGRCRSEKVAKLPRAAQRGRHAAQDHPGSEVDLQVGALLHLNGENFDFTGRQYLQPIYDRPTKQILLKTARQVEKTTTSSPTTSSWNAVVRSYNKKRSLRLPLAHPDPPVLERKAQARASSRAR